MTACRKRRLSGATSVGDDRILPLINVIFLLLIFFMLVGRLLPADPFRMEPVLTSAAGRTTDNGTLVSLSSGGALAVDGTVYDDAAAKSAVIAARTASNSARFLLKADARVSSARVIEVMKMLRDAEVTAVTLLTVHGAP